MAKWQQDLDDATAILTDIARFLKMEFADYKRHIEAHPEDKLHNLNLPNRRWLHISADSSDRFWSLAKRQMKIDPESVDLDHRSMNESIRSEFAQMFVIERRSIDRSSVDKMLARAVKKAKAAHRPLTHYLPCVLLMDEQPHDFKVGPVRFIHRTVFFSEYWRLIEDDLREATARNRIEAERLIDEGKLPGPLKSPEQFAEIDVAMLAWTREYYEESRWIAEVSVPSCNRKVSRTRAELAVQAALDFLKLFVFGWYDGRRLHLAAHHAIIDKVSDVTRQDDGHFTVSWSRGGNYAHAPDGWFDKIKQAYGGYLDVAGQLIEAHIAPDQPFDIAARWLDALSWYGQAVSERLPSAQIVKYVAALERLTITDRTPTDGDRGLTDAVTRRAALFAAGNDDDVRRTRRSEARELYRLRSALMHGRTSPISKVQTVSDEWRMKMAKADELTRAVLVAALGEYAHLLLSDRRTDDDLEERIRVLEAAFGIGPEPTE